MLNAVLQPDSFCAYFTLGVTLVQKSLVSKHICKCTQSTSLESDQKNSKVIIKSVEIEKEHAGRISPTVFNIFGI